MVTGDVLELGMNIPMPCGATLVLDDDVALPGKPSRGSHGYAQVWNGQTVVLVHRLIMGLTKGDGLTVDHIDGNRLNCRRENLRVVTASESSANVAARAASGYRGVSRRHNRWQALVKVAGKQHYLGLYATPEEAAEVAHAFRVAHLPGYIDRPAARRVV